MNINGLILLALLSAASTQVMAQDVSVWMELKAKNRYERTAIVNEGFDIVAVEDDRVIAFGPEHQLEKAAKLGILLERYVQGLSPFDFPQKDEQFTNYEEMSAGLKQLANYYPSLMQLSAIGQTLEKRDIWGVRISALPAGTPNLPASIIMGGHHAREHVSIEMTLRTIQFLLQEYANQNPRIVALLNKFEVFIIPMVNPDGAEFDISTGKYQSWRKNRRPNGDGTYGVDLNRNYGFGWGGGGASKSTSDDTYRGPSAFSENETQVVKKFVEAHLNARTLLTFHTFSKLVLWPWGHQDGEIANAADMKAFKTMGTRMAQMNGYKPMQSSGLYIASGDTCDWAYGQHGIFAFTFELDPASMWEGGFYPGQAVVEAVFNKNIEPVLYLIESAEDPHKAR